MVISKYIHVNKGGEEFCELFDFAKDPHEFDNVIDQPEYQAPLSELRKQLTVVFMRKLLA